MASFDSLTNLELRKKLLDFGYDLPVSPQNRDLLIRKLKNVTADSHKAKESQSESGSVTGSGVSGRRKSGGRATMGVVNMNINSETIEAKKINALAKTRLSLNHQELNTNDDANESLERQERFTNYLNLFRDGSGATVGSGISSEQQQSARSRGGSSRYASYSEDESEDENEQLSPSKFQKVRNFLNPVGWVKNLNLNVFKANGTTNGSRTHLDNIHSTPTLYSSRSRGGPLTVGFNNGSSGGGHGLFSKKYFSSLFEQKDNGGRRETEATQDGSPNISKYLLFTLIGFFLVVGLCYFNQIKGNQALTGPTIPVNSPPSVNRASLSGNYPICGLEGVSNTDCIDKDRVKICRALFNQLKVELVERAKWKGCTANDGVVTLDKAKDLLYRLSDYRKHEIDDAYRGMLFLCFANPKWGLQIHSSDDTNIKSSSELSLTSFHDATISAKDVAPYFFCKVWSGLYLGLYYVVLTVLLTFTTYLVFVVWKYAQKRKKREEDETFELVEQILDLLYQQYEKSRETGCEAFLAVNHIRDEMVPPKEKQSKAALWSKAVNYISENESRIREEIQHISGEEFRVWRWLPGASPLTSQRKSIHATNSPAHLPSLSPANSGNKWQGQAFEMSDKGPNSVPVTPTTCLKIRHMWDANSGSLDQALGKVEQAILEKCTSSAILHIGIDPMSPDGCVYVKCATKDDARTAYFDLHGWWFDGHLLSVKFLREERYLTRFPTAKDRTTRMQMYAPSLLNQFVPGNNNANVSHRSRNQ